MSMTEAWLVRLSLNGQDARNVLTARSRSVVRAAVADADGVLLAWATDPPDMLGLVLTVPQSSRSDIQKLADALREALGLLPGAIQIDSVSPADLDLLVRSFQVRGAAGKGWICRECGGVDEHRQSCPLGRTP